MKPTTTKNQLIPTPAQKGMALHEIREKRLYRDHGSFEDYYKLRFGFTTRMVNGFLAEAGKPLEIDNDPPPAKKVSGLVYVLSSGGLFKIGMTLGPLKSRVQSLQTACPIPISVEFVIECAKAREVELELHNLFRKCRKHGEWFALTAADLSHIKAEYGKQVGK